MTERGRAGHVAAARQLGAALRGLQQRSGRTLRALEERVRVSDSSLSRYFRGDTVPPWPVVRDLCQALGADPAGYRALWEAADRGQPDGPELPEHPEPAVGTLCEDTQGSSGFRWWRRTRGRLRGRWVCAAAGTSAGLLMGVLLTLPGLWTVSADSAGDAKAPDPSVQGGEIPKNAPALAQSSRIFVSRATGRCLDDSLDQGLRSYGCNGMSYQWWTVRQSADGTRRLRGHATGRCLADGGAGLRALPCDRTTSQKWVFTSGDDEAVGLRNKATGRCLDDSTAGLRVLPCKDTHHQKWA
ncbi:helix-turn-helix domain-containing protein [Streptomyces sp. NPDC047000]|uniref:helix-turn-helix domain-containing protein n=1 Tax=Streptomyces sp. NPDC047000 TaxID=3155474 RepID=UPI0033D450AE